jgi:hypothetical protein
MYRIDAASELPEPREETGGGGGSSPSAGAGRLVPAIHPLPSQ